MGVTPVPNRADMEKRLPSSAETRMEPPAATKGRVLDAGASVSLPDEEVQPIIAEAQGYAASTEARTFIRHRSMLAASTANDAFPPGSDRSFLQAWVSPKPMAGDHTDFRSTPANAYRDTPGIIVGAGPNHDWPMAYKTNPWGVADGASIGGAGDSATAAEGLGWIGGRSANLAIESVGDLLGKEEAGAGGPDGAVVPADAGVGSAARRSVEDDPAAPFRADVGSSVTAMTKATASAASAQDRAVTRRGSGFSPVAATTISAITLPGRSAVNATRAVYAPSSTNRMRADRAATSAMISSRDTQSDLAWRSSRTVDTSAPSEGPLFKSNETSTTLTGVIARDGSITQMLRLACLAAIVMATASCGGEPIRLGDGYADGGTACVHGQIKANEVIWIGDSWITDPGTQHTGVRDLARAAGVLGANEDYVVLAQAAKTISQIADQYNAREASANKVKVIIMEGGGWDLIAANGSDAAVTSVVSTFTQFLAKVGSDGTVQHIIYFLYPELPTTPNVAGLRPGVRSACAESKVPCHFLDLQPFWVGHPEYTAVNGVQASDVGGQVIAEQIWEIMQENCIAQ